MAHGLPSGLGAGDGEGTGAPVYFAFENLTEDRIQGHVARDRASPSAEAGPSLQGADLVKLWGDLPLAVVTLRRDLAELAA